MFKYLSLIVCLILVGCSGNLGRHKFKVGDCYANTHGEKWEIKGTIINEVLEVGNTHYHIRFGYRQDSPNVLTDFSEHFWIADDYSELVPCPKDWK